MAMVTIEVADQSFDIKVKQTSSEARYWRAAWTKNLKAESVMRPRHSEVVTESLVSKISSMAEWVRALVRAADSRMALC